MPQPALHLRLAEDALEMWAKEPARAPFRVADAACRNAFMHGALAPDMGYFPGATAAIVSECAHAHGASAVARALVYGGDTVSCAFGWGWVTHVLADARIHPLVNESGDALLEAGCSDTALRLVSHIRVELGLEGYYARRSSGKRRARLVHAFDRHSVAPLAATLNHSLGLAVPPDQILTAHRGVTTFALVCDGLAAVLAADLALPEAPPARADFLRLPGVRRAASRLFPRSSPIYGFLNPVRPTRALIERVNAEIDAILMLLQHHVETRLDELPEYDLDTGRIVRCAQQPRLEVA